MNSDEINKKKLKIREKETVENKTIIAIRCLAYSYACILMAALMAYAVPIMFI